MGALALIDGQVNVIWAKQTILATGGAGQLYRETTNPKIATADGQAMAWRAGAALQDMEMMQFHPTTLYVAGSSRALITEAVRGEGAYLVDREGPSLHARLPSHAPSWRRATSSAGAIVQQIRKTNFTHVYLDVRHLPTQKFRERFPQLAELMDQFEIDVSKDLIPIHPAAHYMIGGVDVDEYGRTSLQGPVRRRRGRLHRPARGQPPRRATRCSRGWRSAPRRHARGRGSGGQQHSVSRRRWSTASCRRPRRSWTSPM